MISSASEQTLAKLLGLGSAFIAVFVITGTVTDPVNVPKLMVLGGVAVSAIMVAASRGWRMLFQEARVALALTVLFLLASISSIVNSTGPFTQNIYGVYGRNTGFVTYLLLILVFLATLVLRRESSFRWLIRGLLISGLINVLYCFWAIQFGDFIPWSNPYGEILGTFGNPNFIGAFLGIFTSVLIAYSIRGGVKWYYRIGILVVFLVGLYEIVESSAIQGRVVAAGGLAIVGFYFIRSRFQSTLVQAIYSVGVLCAGVIALLGALQIGPLTKYIYKTSVSLRGEYWQAGWNMALEKPITGIGFDTYGDWYRRARDTQALILPGPKVTTNAAHNVPFDVLAFGGWPLFLVYLGFIALVVVAIVKYTFKVRAYDPVFVSLLVGWVCYQVQSIISINQIGLAIWGWLFGGALIAYVNSRLLKPSNENATKVEAAKKKRAKTTESVFSAQLLASIGAVLGLIIASPPYSADAKWRSALSSNNVQKVEEALTPGYLNPMNSYKYTYAVQLLENSKLYDLAYKYGKIAVEFNPDNFDSWRIFYILSKATPEEKANALDQMKRLDPNNPDVLA
jgi:O-antigen ligase